MHKKREKLSIIADLQLFSMGMLLFVILISGCVWMYTMSANGATAEDVRGLKAIAIVSGLLSIAACALCLPRWYTRITFLPEGICSKTAFKKPTLYSYKHYQYVYKTWYRHGSPIGVGVNVFYIVLSHRRLKDEEVQNINQMAPNPNVLKIRYSRKTYDTLMGILPKEMQNRLRICGFEKEK